MSESEVGGGSNREIVSCRAVRASVRAGWLPSGIGSQKSLPAISLFPFGLGELSLYPFWLGGLFLFLCVNDV